MIKPTIYLSLKYKREIPKLKKNHKKLKLIPGKKKVSSTHIQSSLKSSDNHYPGQYYLISMH